MKLMKPTLFAAALFFSTFSLSLANTDVLAKISSNTYVKSYHPDDYTADTYTGYLSVLGTDRYTSNGNSYPSYSRITYRKDGVDTRYYVYSKGETDNQLRKTVTYKDDWDFGAKTEVFGFIGTSSAKYTISSIPKESK